MSGGPRGRLKTIENSKTVSPKSGRGRLQEVVVYERFPYKVVTEDIFGVLGRLSLMGGGRLREVIARGGSTVKLYSIRACWI